MNVVNAKNLFCPMPVIRTQDMANELKTGDEFIVEATDPGVKNDIPAWCRINGHEVLSVVEKNNLVIIKVRVNHD
jgi:tRNA 2-thiouridine synthesizing protein A